jgi:hypothetical protein
MQSHVLRLQRKLNPSSSEPDAPFAWPVQKISLHQLSQVMKDGGITAGMKTVTAIVNRQTFQLKAACIATNIVPLLE